MAVMKQTRKLSVVAHALTAGDLRQLIDGIPDNQHVSLHYSPAHPQDPRESDMLSLEVDLP